jgi:hypothetical protein
MVFIPILILEPVKYVGCGCTWTAGQRCAVHLALDHGGWAWIESVIESIIRNRSWVIKDESRTAETACVELLVVAVPAVTTDGEHDEEDEDAGSSETAHNTTNDGTRVACTRRLR